MSVHTIVHILFLFNSKRQMRAGVQKRKEKGLR